MVSTRVDCYEHITCILAFIYFRILFFFLFIKVNVAIANLLLVNAHVFIFQKYSEN